MSHGERVASLLIVVVAVACSPVPDEARPAAAVSSTALATTTTTLDPPATTTPKPVPDPTTTVQPTTTTTPEASITYQAGVVTAVGGFSFPLGTPATITIVSDVAAEAHLHGYDITVPLKPGIPTALTFPADIPGIFELELEASGEVLTDVEVAP